jgi:phosphoribosylformylglycinamidine cyclo-ligase
VLLDQLRLGLDDMLPDTDTTVGDALLAVHRSYEAAIRPALPDIHGMAHITGGGIAGNLVRVLPPGVEAIIDPASWRWPALFQVISDAGVSRVEMRDVFNLGVGMIAAVAADRVDAVRGHAERAGVAAWVIGQVRAGGRAVTFAD